jgi:hypothetical protein
VNGGAVSALAGGHAESRPTGDQLRGAAVRSLSEPAPSAWALAQL